MSHILISSRLPSPPILSSPLLLSHLVSSHLFLSFQLLILIFSHHLLILSLFRHGRNPLVSKSSLSLLWATHKGSHFVCLPLVLSPFVSPPFLWSHFMSSCLVLSNLPSHTLPLITSLSSSSFLSSCLFFFSSRLLFFSLSSPRLMSSHFILPPSSLLFAHPFSLSHPLFFSPCILSSSPDDAETPWNLCFHSFIVIIDCRAETHTLSTVALKLYCWGQIVPNSQEKGRQLSYFPFVFPKQQLKRK